MLKSSRHKHALAEPKAPMVYLLGEWRREDLNTKKKIIHMEIDAVNRGLIL